MILLKAIKIKFLNNTSAHNFITDVLLLQTVATDKQLPVLHTM